MLDSSSTAIAIGTYLSELEGAARAPRTIANYRHHLGPLQKHAPSLPCSAGAVRSALDDRKQSGNTRHQQLRSIRRFLRWTGTPDPTAHWPKIKVTIQIPRVFSDAEIDRIIETATTERDELLFLTLLDTGIRIGEAAGMRTSDLEERWLRVDGKTGPRKVPISEWLVQELMELANGDAIWQARGRPGQPMPEESLQKTVVRELKKAGITGRRCGAHTFRHSFGTKFIESAGDVVALQAIMGHATLEQTRQYVTLAGDHVLNEHGQHSPARRFAPKHPHAAVLAMPASGVRTVIDAVVHLVPVDGEVGVAPDEVEWMPDAEGEYRDGFRAGYRQVLDDFSDISEALQEDVGGLADVRTIATLSLIAIKRVLALLDELARS